MVVAELGELLHASQEEVEQMNMMLDTNMEREGTKMAELKIDLFNAAEELKE